MIDRIDRFLADLEEQADGHYEIVAQLRELVTSGFPDADELFKYGGLHYTFGSAPFAGIYAYKNHVSVEINGGAYIEDIYGHLEGRGGKSGRKHVRLSSVAEIGSKHVADYLTLARETF
ncbi:DUF1801 domain-containing protein [Leucobacter luti]|jgi:hypothetical protein|uniref:Uncharacterized protein DUF1801 n=1 Tax=Leucobacter luti TaxID=340320 RepID=A0A4Q7TLS0_9MICO|nr:DUF1801 domain-containing protein [Leucobacter luti]MBK8868665.1 DUF1801 domain-containing protein [Actinomycetales bacterium]MBL3700342.1 DUF1801 domain-containing protein [Leucobacter luti]MBP8881872.1 DUF1801 domain-containing protein [Dermatophilaceae bacterium]RZT60628.1 uncharacterized protein DUF1801 [Leucobacter luti]